MWTTSRRSARRHRVPIFGVSSDHEEIGRIQGHQFAALLPKGGTVLHIQGPSESLAAKQRTTGMYETKPADVQVKVMRAQWTETSSYRAVSSWLRLSTSHQNRIDLIAAQDDGMALGARKAFQELPDTAARQRWLSLPFIGCDGLPKTGQAWVKRGLLTATIFAGPNTGEALEMLVKALQTGTMPPENTLTTPLRFRPSMRWRHRRRRRRVCCRCRATFSPVSGFWLSSLSSAAIFAARMRLLLINWLIDSLFPKEKQCPLWSLSPRASVPPAPSPN